MSLTQILFLVFSAVIIGAALMVVLSRRIMRAALWLVLALFGVALIFALLDASFFAVVQVLVYVGAIATLLIFAVMLTRGVMDDSKAQLNRGWPFALLACLAFFGGLVWMLSQWDQFNSVAPALPQDAYDLTLFGLALSSPDGFLVPFEAASVLLLAAMIGAIYLALEKRGTKE